MKLDLINNTPEETRHQLSELLASGDQGKALDEISSEVNRLSRFAKQGYAKWRGTKKGRDDNLSRAIKASIDHLRDKGQSLNNGAIIANLYYIDAGKDIVHSDLIIQEVVKKPNPANSYVAWVDQRGIERESSFSSVRGRICRIKKKY